MSQYCQAKMNNVLCDTLTFGSLVRGFEPLGVWSGRPNPSEVFMIISELAYALCSIQILKYTEDLLGDINDLNTCSVNQSSVPAIKNATYTFNLKASWNNHSGCNFKEKFNEDIKRIMDNIPPAVLSSHLLHMEEQAKTEWT